MKDMPQDRPEGHPYRELSATQMLFVLDELSKDRQLRDRIDALSKSLLSRIDEEEMADRVFRRLNSIDVVALWEASGKDYFGGYNDPSEVAADMMDEAIRGFRSEMQKYRRLGMRPEEEVCFRAIIKGLQEYAEEGSNEFRDWVPDDPWDFIENELYDWCNAHPEADGIQLRNDLGLNV